MTIHPKITQVQSARWQGIFREDLVILLRIAMEAAGPGFLTRTVVGGNCRCAVGKTTGCIGRAARDNVRVIICWRRSAAFRISAQRQKNFEPGARFVTKRSGLIVARTKTEKGRAAVFWKFAVSAYSLLADSCHGPGRIVRLDGINQIDQEISEDKLGRHRFQRAGKLNLFAASKHSSDAEVT